MRQALNMRLGSEDQLGRSTSDAVVLVYAGDVQNCQGEAIHRTLFTASVTLACQLAGPLRAENILKTCSLLAETG